MDDFSTWEMANSVIMDFDPALEMSFRYRKYDKENDKMVSSRKEVESEAIVFNNINSKLYLLCRDNGQRKHFAIENISGKVISDNEEYVHIGKWLEETYGMEYVEIQRKFIGQDDEYIDDDYCSWIDDADDDYIPLETHSPQIPITQGEKTGEINDGVGCLIIIGIIIGIIVYFNKCMT